MKGDFTRDTFDPAKHFTSVLMQQGRVQLDADWNEQARILLHRIETMARDLIGMGGGPDAAAGGGFDIDVHVDDRDFVVSPGRYYVEGMLVENEASVFYSSHGVEPGRPTLERDKIYLVYLDAWKDFVAAFEDPSMRDIGLGGADTAGRARAHWRVRAQEIPAADNCGAVFANFVKQVGQWRENRGRLRARVNPGAVPVDDPCIIPPSSRYRGSENQLYRVEIHRGGSLGPAKGGSAGPPAFKWSRENGSVVYPVIPGGVSGDKITVENTGRDVNLSLRPGDWVELDTGAAVGTGVPAHMLRVARVDLSRNEVFFKDKVPDPRGAAVLRRWDQKPAPENRGGSPLPEGVVPVREGDGELNWIPLENGIEVQFQRKDTDPRNAYGIGDYWLIPARTANSGQIDWPSAEGDAVYMPPNGIFHRYAPLAAIQFKKDSEILCHLRKTMGVVVDIEPPPPK